MVCNLTSAQSGTNTANLTGCVCPTSTNSVTIPDQHDTATIACAGVEIDKEISCKSGITGSFVDVGLETSDQDGATSCTGTAGVAGQIVAKFQAENTGNVPLTCTLSDTNTNFIPALVPGISLSNNIETLVGPGTTSGLECLAALKGVSEPDKAVLACTFAPATGIVDKTVAGSLTVFDRANFNCSNPSFLAQKTCALTAGDTFNVGVTVFNTDTSGNSSLSCAITDETYTGTCGVGTASTGPTIMPSPLSVGPSTSTCNPATGAGCTSSIGTGTFSTSTSVCNQAIVTCTSGSLTLPVQNPTAECSIPSGGIKLKKVFSEDAVAADKTVTVTFTIINQGSTTLNGLAFTDTFPPHTSTLDIPSMSACGGSYSVTGDVLTFSGGTLTAGDSCSISVTLTADPSQTTPLRVCDTTSSVTSTTLTGAPAYACVTIGSTPLAPPDGFQLNYVSNLGIGDSVVNLTNSGALSGTDPAGDICVNVYAFDPAEEMISCCSCLVTPNALDSLSVLHDLVSNTLTPGTVSSVVIKMLANAPDPGLCNASSPNFQNLTPGLLAWGTTLHQNSATGNYLVTESAFQKATLSPTELIKLSSYCGFIQSTGSGYGICNSCRLGGLGATTK